MAAIALTKSNFEQTVTGNDTVVVDFWATWCGPCQSFGPIFEKVSEKFPDVVFGKVNTEEEQELAAYFQVRSIPTLVIIRDQLVLFSQPGSLPEPALEEVVTKVLALDMDKIRQDMEALEAEAGKGSGE